MSVYFVLGMHKSGTTLVSRILHSSGINMVDDVSSLTYDQGFKFERITMQEINKAALQGCLIPTLGHTIRRPFTPLRNQAGYIHNVDAVALVRHKTLANRLSNHDLHSDIGGTVEELSNRYSDWGFKDPRTCLTYPMWNESVPEHKIIVVFRHYRQLLQRFSLSSFAAAQIPLAYRVLNVWATYNQYILDVIEKTTLPVVVLSYEKLMEEELQFQRLSQFVGKPLTDTRDRQLYRNRNEKVKHSINLPVPLYTRFHREPQSIYDELLNYSMQDLAFKA